MFLWAHYFMSILVGGAVFVRMAVPVDPGLEEGKSGRPAPVLENKLLEAKVDPVKDEALSYFAAPIRAQLASLPIYYNPGVRTGVSVVDGEKAIHLSVLWNSLWQDGSPVFTPRFKLQVLVHEYSHHAFRLAGHSLQPWCREVLDWYRDTSAGAPKVDDNYTKYLIYWQVYGGNGLRNDYGCHSPIKNTEEYAYLGWQLADNVRAWEIPDNVKKYYLGVLQDYSR